MSAASPDTLRLSNSIAELRIPTTFGPRVMHYGFAGGPSVLAASVAHRETPHGTWRAYGGHRLWVAPERFPQTYTLDDAAPEIERRGERSVVVRRAVDPLTHLRVELGVTLAEASSEVLLEHVVRNEGDAPCEAAAWGITIVRPNGVAVIPNPRFAPQPDALLPVRTLALWRYTDLADGRFAAGPSFVRLRCDPARTAPTKIGVACERGWFAYVVDGTALVVRSARDAEARYPDFNSNVEIYTEGEFCEVETLGPLVSLQPGQALRHLARWTLVRVSSDDDAALLDALSKHALE